MTSSSACDRVSRGRRWVKLAVWGLTSAILISIAATLLHLHSLSRSYEAAADEYEGSQMVLYATERYGVDVRAIGSSDEPLLPVDPVARKLRTMAGIGVVDLRDVADIESKIDRRSPDTSAVAADMADLAESARARAVVRVGAAAADVEQVVQAEQTARVLLLSALIALIIGLIGSLALARPARASLPGARSGRTRGSSAFFDRRATSLMASAVGMIESETERARWAEE